MVKNLPAAQETQEMSIRSLGWENPMDRGAEDAHGLQSLGLQKVGQD